MRTIRRVSWVALAVLVVGRSAVAAAVKPGKELGPRQAYAQCAPSVVMVTAVESFPRGLANRSVDLLNPFPLLDLPADAMAFVLYPFYAAAKGPLKAGGSGVIIDAEGHFLTNHHVIEGSDVFWATLHDRRVIRARVVGADEDEDYALLKLDLQDGEKVTPARLGDSGQLRPGDRVYAIGSPLGLRQSLSAGIVSGVERRSIGPFQDFIQTDLTIGMGSSGGPLFNARGDVVGITTLIHATFEQTGGISLSIPINCIQEGLDRLKSEGEVVRGFIGLHIRDVTPRARHELELDAKSGALVVETEWSTWGRCPARDAGLKSGDVIVKYGDKKIDRARPLARAVLNTKPGSHVKVEFYRGTSLLEREVKVIER